MRRQLIYAAGLTTAWVMLWDRISVANVIGGLAVGIVLLVAFPIRPVDAGSRIAFHPLAFARLALVVVPGLVVSNLLVAREIISPNARLRTGIVACPIRTSSPKLLGTVANILALSPGTIAVEATDNPATLYVHVLSLDDVLDVRREVAELEALVLAAFGRRADSGTQSGGGDRGSESNVAPS